MARLRFKASTTKSTMLRILAIVILISLGSPLATGQAATGTPPFGSFAGGDIDTIDLANMNVHLAVPLMSKAGRGLPFSYALGYDSSIWYVNAQNKWTPVQNFGWHGGTEVVTGYLTYTPATTPCQGGGGQVVFLYQNFVYHDPNGTLHNFTGTAQDKSQCINPLYINLHTTTPDGSGYKLDTNLSAATFTVTSKNGTVINTPVNSTNQAGSIKDRNGNRITTTGTSYTDTLGATVLSVSGSGTQASPLLYKYTNPQGTLSTITVNYTNYNIKTNFLCTSSPTIAEYTSSAAVPLITSIVFPDNSQYAFTYEDTYLNPGYKTARIASVTLPTGGSVQYSYTDNCTDHGTDQVYRTTSPGGTWLYDRSLGGPRLDVVIDFPFVNPINNTALVFQGSYETKRTVSYKPAGSWIQLETITTCYNGNLTNCDTTAVTPPITRRTITRQRGSKQSKVDLFYDTFGSITEMDEYDWGNGAPGSLVRKTLTSYGSWNGTACVTLGNNILNQPCLVTVQDSGGATKAQKTFTYDETTPTATTGTPQLVAITGSRGNLTTTTSMVGASTNLTKHFSYYDTGTTNVVTDVNGATTTTSYGSGSCGNSFPTGVSMPLGLTRSMIWSCNGGGMTSVTDENGNITSTAYTDSNYWRPTSATDELNNITNLTYTGLSAFESLLTFNNGGSVSDRRTTLDGLGRPVAQQVRQSASANYDSIETDYDGLGRISKVTMPYAAAGGGLCTGTCPGVSKTYDALNRVLTTTDAGGGSVTNTYANNDVFTSIGPSHDSEGTKDKQLEYDALGRLTSVCEITTLSGSGTCGQTTSKIGFWTKYTYDVLGNLTVVTQNAQAASGQQTRTFAYDMLGRLTSETNPETGTKTYTYDSDASGTCTGTYNGDLVKQVDNAGNVTCYTYDSLHRVYIVTYPSGPNSTATPARAFEYDNLYFGNGGANLKGRLVAALTCQSNLNCLGNSVTGIYFGYSKRGEVTDVWEFTPHSGGTYHLTASYWPHGAINSLAGIPGLPTLYYGASDGSGLDGEGRVTKVTASTGQNPVTGVTYTSSGTTQPIGSLTQATYGSSDYDNFSYDPATGRLNQYKFNVGATPQTDTGTLTWNANGTLAQLAVVDQLNSSDTQTCNYVHDDLGRISSVNCGTAWSQSFSFDPFGNIAKSGSSSFQAGYIPVSGPTSNRIQSLSGCTPPFNPATAYDANGALLWDCVHNYTWDAEGRMLSVDGTLVTTTYDALGRMVEQNRGGSYTQVVYSPVGTKLALMNGQTLSNAFVALPGGATAVYSVSGLQYYRHPDWLGSSRLATTQNRTVYSSTAYGPYGENYANLGTSVDLSFTGQNQDTVPGIYDFMYRGYSPVQGRWMSPDPAGLGAVDPTNPQSWNQYGYVGNTPMNTVDPLGLTDCRSGRACADQNKVGGGSGIIDCLGSEACASGGGLNLYFVTLALTPTSIRHLVPNVDDGCLGCEKKFVQQTTTVYPLIGLLNLLFTEQSDENAGRTGGIKDKLCSAMPSGRVIGVSGGAGGLGATMGGGEIVLNYNSGQVTAFGFGGFQAGWNGVLSASAYSGYAWGLSDDNANYQGGFTGFSASIPAGGIFGARSSGGLTGGTAGLKPISGPGTVTVGGLSVGVSLLGKIGFGVNATNYTTPLQLGKFWAFTPADLSNFMARQMCK